jgi:ATP-independent RNA helicase DbpA
MNFNSLRVSESLLKCISDSGFSEMTPIQEKCIPALLEGSDLIGQSKTGSGKTAAFLIPLIEKLQGTEARPQALILCPTRELCDQVLREARKFSKALPGFQTVALVGGQPYPPQVQALGRGVQLIVGTPGRTLEHLKSGNFLAADIETLVLDEADRMLDEGFADEMTSILQELPQKRQTVLFSATFTENMKALCEKFLPAAVHVAIEELADEKLSIEQYNYECESEQKMETLIKVLQRHPSQCTLIFCRMKSTVDEVGKMLSEFKVSCQVLHGDLTQVERDRATAMFRNGSVRVLVATDVAARGLDIEHLELVVNLDLPINAETYIHRIGRTGRAGRTGSAVSISTPYEIPKIFEIEKTTGVKMIHQPLGFKNQLGLGQEFQATRNKTLQISGGRVDKLRPGDILGALTAAPGALSGQSIGKIEIHERFSYIAVNSVVAHQALQKLRLAKIKGHKFKAFLNE